MGSSTIHDTRVHQARVPFCTGSLFIQTLLKNWPLSTRALWAQVLCVVPESIKLGYHFGFPLDSRTKRRIYFSSPKIIFITPFAFQFSKKSFKKHKKKKKTLRDWNFLGENPVLRGDKSHTVHGYFDTSPSTIAGGASRGGRAIHQRTLLLSPFVSMESPSNSSKGARYVFNLPTLYSCVIQWFEDIALLGICFFSLNVKACCLVNKEQNLVVIKGS